MPPGFTRVEKLLFVYLFCMGVMAYKYNFDLFVVSFQKQIQQDKEAFGHIFYALCHGAGYVHDTEHHRFTGRDWDFDHVVVFNVKVIKKGDSFQSEL